MISHDLKCIFVHIPKTGGRSIQQWMGSTSKNIEASQDIVHAPHSPCSWYAHNHDNVFDNYFKFSFVRNPWEKLLSEYFYMRRWNGCDAAKHGVDFSTSFKTFQDFVLFGGIKYSWEFHANAQLDLLDGPMDFVGRFENLQEDFDHVCDHIGIDRHALPHINKSKHKHYTEYYDDITRRIVVKMYEKDIEHFGYKFGE